jgi:hypothetical protein
MMLLNVGGATSTIQLIVFVIPIDALDGSDRLGEWLCRVGSGTRQRGCELARQRRSCRLGEPSFDQPVEPIGLHSKFAGGSAAGPAMNYTSLAAQILQRKARMFGERIRAFYGTLAKEDWRDEIQDDDFPGPAMPGPARPILA